MQRRDALLALPALALAACGGGGGDAPAAGVPAVPATSPATAPPQAAVALSPNIACWGDSLTPAFAANLQLLVGSREVYDGGVVGQTSVQIAARQTADTAHRNWISIFWYGANNPTQPEQVKADIASSVAALAPGNDRYYVLSVVNVANAAGEPGGAAYADILQLNRDLAALYPGHFFDMRSFLVGLFDPNQPQDVQDHQMDLVPSSLRFDEIHLNNNGSVAVAQKVKALLDAKGW